MNLCKVPGKKVSGKKPGNKNFGKNVSIFQSPRTKCHCKFSGNKIIKVQEKIYPKKRKPKKKSLVCENEVKSETFS